MRSPKWASVTNGILVCLNCSGLHRGLGVGISFVRSVDMDKWSDKYLARHLKVETLLGFYLKTLFAS